MKYNFGLFEVKMVMNKVLQSKNNSTNRKMSIDILKIMNSLR